MSASTTDAVAAANAFLTNRRGAVLRVVLNRPEQRNAVNQAVAEGLSAALGTLDVKPDLRFGVLVGVGDGVPYRPTVVTGLQPTHALVRDELFGPVTAVLRADDEDEALRLANATEYGLAAAVFTGDLDRALRFSRALRAGVVFVNAATVEAETQLPFGGIGASGNGSRDTGLAALETYTEWKTTYLAPAGTVPRARRV